MELVDLTGTPQEVAEELALDHAEGLILSLFQYRLMHRDIAGDQSPRRRTRKRPMRDEFRESLFDSLDALAGDGRLDSPPWVHEFVLSFSVKGRDDRLDLLERAPGEVAPHLTRRSRALLLLIDLYGFEPWGDAGTWHKSTRQQVLEEFVSLVPAIRPDDLRNVAREYTTVMRALRLKSVKWGRLALLTGGGMALGAVSFGLAAPVIGAAVGSAVLGLGGAAATSAGLAALGGGSLAAGGFGMAGGTALLVGTGGVAGAGAFAAGGKWTGWTVGQLVTDAVKLEVVTRLILIENEGDDEKARKVVEGLQARITALADQVLDAARKIEQYRKEIAELKELGDKKDARIQELADKLRETERIHNELTFGEAALVLAGKRIESSLIKGSG